MEHYTRKSVFEKLKVFDPLCSDDSFIEVSEWHNGEGYDITIGEKPVVSLSWGELDAINYLVNSIHFGAKEKKND